MGPKVLTEPCYYLVRHQMLLCASVAQDTLSEGVFRKAALS